MTRLRRPFALLEDRRDPAAPARLYRRAQEVIRCDRPEDALSVIGRIEAATASGLHAVGFCSYELGYALEPRLHPLMPQDREHPLMWFALFGPPKLVPQRMVDAVFARLGPPAPIEDVAYGHDRQTHRRKVSRILDLIAAGDLYQANLTFPIRFRHMGDPFKLYAALRTRQPVAHGGVIGMEAGTILSVSPELFLSVEGGVATARPMKGTAPRPADPAGDEAAKAALLADPKQRAENLMIVDLMRNDLSRVARPGSVKVPTLFTVETYPGFHTLTSTVTAELDPGASLVDRLTALFPCGSIVGAPKVRAAEVIRSLEAEPRGIYTGAIGVIRPGGEMDFNVAIRTAWIGAGGEGRYGVGGGIVADSDPDGEYDEALLKGRALTDLAADYALIETFRWSVEAGFVRLAQHLDRLAGSANALGFLFARTAAERDLEDVAHEWAQDRRVRVLLNRDGAVEITSAAAPLSVVDPADLIVSTVRLDRGDPFLRHKTTRRSTYDQASAEADTAGADEAVLLNREGEVADGARTTVFAEIDGRVLTPPIAAGALPGVLRAALLVRGWAVEGRLTPADLARADRLFIGNSLRGLREARWRGAENATLVGSETGPSAREA